MSGFPLSSSDFSARLHADVWPADALARSAQPVLSSAYPMLDAELPGGGWPIGAMVEVLQRPGVHLEWRLLLPALARSGTAAVVLVGAPHVPMAPVLAVHGLSIARLLWVPTATPASRLWAAEQALRCADVDAVLVWLPNTGAVRADMLRRLHVVATDFSKLLFVMRAQDAQAQSSAAPLRLQIDPHAFAFATEPSHTPSHAPFNPPFHPPLHAAPLPPRVGLWLHIFKRRGPAMAQALFLPGHEQQLAALTRMAAPDGLDRPAPRPDVADHRAAHASA